MWDFLRELLNTHGIWSVITVAQTGAIVFLYRVGLSRHKQLLALQEKRIRDVKEFGQNYMELSQRLERSLDIIIKLVRAKGD